MPDHDETPAASFRITGAARYTGLSVREIQRMLAAGEIPYGRQGRAVLIPRAGLDDWLRRKLQENA